ncbi:MAG: hypothetical protein K2K47_09305, partial [Duncaniella sp.]|nr:hypothetical protein [Duncaniella sp.]
MGEQAAQSAVEAASAEVDTDPTEAQKKAGNYKMGHVKVDGFDITIENPKGSVRRGTDADGNAWETKMNNTYGYIRGTEGVDGDHIDVFLSDKPEEGDVFVVDQVNSDGTFDEHKVMYGFATEEEARTAYLSNYAEGWNGLGAITRVSKEDFKKWVQSSHRKTKPFADYAMVKGERFDNQGNPIDAESKFIVESVESVADITDADLTEPTRTVGLPALSDNVSDVLGAEGRKPIIKRNIFNKNRTSHNDLTPEYSRKILNEVLYNPDLYGQNQKETRPYNWTLVHLADKNSAVIVEVNPTKEYLEIVNWHYLSGETLERKKRQAIKEVGRILTLSKDNAAADTHDGLSSEGKGSESPGDKQIMKPENTVNGSKIEDFGENLTGGTRIESRDDVAWLFRSLENMAVEHTFCVAVKDGKARVIHTGMGGPFSSPMSLMAVRATMEAWEPEKIWFVHNHPSGALKPSIQDQTLLRHIEDMMEGKCEVGAIIMDARSGRYAEFGSAGYNGYGQYERPRSGETEEYRVMQFDRQEFHTDSDGETEQMTTPDRVAAFVSKQRLGTGRKVGFMVVDEAHHIGQAKAG